MAKRQEESLLEASTQGPIYNLHGAKAVLALFFAEPALILSQNLEWDSFRRNPELCKGERSETTIQDMADIPASGG